MEIETKFNVGQVVFGVEDEWDEKLIKCNFCGGEKEIVLKDFTKITCPICRGTGMGISGKRKYTITKYRIASIKVFNQDISCSGNSSFQSQIVTSYECTILNQNSDFARIRNHRIDKEVLNDKQILATKKEAEERIKYLIKLGEKKNEN